MSFPQQDLNSLPADLRLQDRFVIYRLELRDGRMTKVPYQAARPDARASSTDSATWSSFKTALAAYNAGHGDGLGFMLGDGFVGIDLDKCINPETGVIEPWAQAIIDAVPGYVEASPSVSGAHIIGRGSLPPGRRRHGQIEMYDRARFFTITARTIRSADELPDITEAVAAIHARLFPADVTTQTADRPSYVADGNDGKENITAADLPRSVAELSDDDLISAARHASNSAKFERLWSGDKSDYEGDDSRADQALCCMLAFYTQKDADRIDRLFRTSGCMRTKWNRKDYRDSTIRRAIALTTEVYEPPLVNLSVPVTDEALVAKGWFTQSEVDAARAINLDEVL